jgi:hypothetical protein
MAQNCLVVVSILFVFTRQARSTARARYPPSLPPPVTSAALSSHGSEDGVVTADGCSVLVVVLLRVAHLVELWGGRKHRPAKPNSVPLHVMRDYLDLHRRGLDAALRVL